MRRPALPYSWKLADLFPALQDAVLEGAARVRGGGWSPAENVFGYGVSRHADGGPASWLRRYCARARGGRRHASERLCSRPTGRGDAAPSRVAGIRLLGPGVPRPAFGERFSCRRVVAGAFDLLGSSDPDVPIAAIPLPARISPRELVRLAGRPGQAGGGGPLGTRRRGPTRVRVDRRARARGSSASRRRGRAHAGLRPARDRLARAGGGRARRAGAALRRRRSSSPMRPFAAASRGRDPGTRRCARRSLEGGVTRGRLRSGPRYAQRAASGVDAEIISRRVYSRHGRASSARIGGRSAGSARGSSVEGLAEAAATRQRALDHESGPKRSTA